MRREAPECKLRDELKGLVGGIGPGWSDGLPMRELEAVSLFVGLGQNKPTTQREIARRMQRADGGYGVGRERARQVLVRATRRIRKNATNALRARRSPRIPLTTAMARRRAPDETVVIHHHTSEGTPRSEWALIWAERGMPCPSQP